MGGTIQLAQSWFAQFLCQSASGRRSRILADEIFWTIEIELGCIVTIESGSSKCTDNVAFTDYLALYIFLLLLARYKILTVILMLFRTSKIAISHWCE